LWQSPKNTKQKKKDIAKSLISGWSFFPEKHQNSAKKEEWKETPLAVRDEKKRKSKKSKSRWQGTSRTNPLRT